MDEGGNELNQPLWQPSADRIASTNLVAFMRAVEDRWGVHPKDYAALHAWSVAEAEKFWLSLWVPLPSPT